MDTKKGPALAASDPTRDQKYGPAIYIAFAPRLQRGAR